MDMKEIENQEKTVTESQLDTTDVLSDAELFKRIIESGGAEVTADEEENALETVKFRTLDGKIASAQVRRPKVFLEERQQQIVEEISREGRIFVGQITGMFGVDEETARRDLQNLERLGLCKCTDGGAVAVGYDKSTKFMEERQREIVTIIDRDGRISTAQIQGMYSVGYETARRDLEQLEKAGLCKRTHGGAIAVEQVNVRPPYDRDFSNMKITEDYLSIAKLAASQIRKNDCIYITSGSLGHLMLKFLPTDIFYTVVVNAADMAKELRAFSNFDVYVAGGKMRQSGSIVDSMAREFVSRLHFDVCFLTGGGLTADFGLSNGTDETAAFQREVIKNSRRKVLLMPSKKLGRDSFVKVCEANEFDQIITDWDARDEDISAFRELGVEVVVTEESK